MRWLASWALYWMGDAVSRLIELMPDGPEWPCDLLYPVYNKLMLKAADVQGDGPGPWQAP